MLITTEAVVGSDGGWESGVSSYNMEEGTDVRQAWPHFSGLEIYLSVYLLILKYMNPPKFSDRHV